MSFDEKYKTIVKCKCDEKYIEKINWLNENTIGNVDIKFLNIPTVNDIINGEPFIMLVGFENSDDALYFRIKYSI